MYSKAVYKKSIVVLFVISLFIGCKQGKNNQDLLLQKHITIVVQPFNGIDSALVNAVVIELKKVYPAVKSNSKINLPKSALNHNKTRYRADSLIHFLRKTVATNEVVISLTTSDISTTKINVQDWGVMGLGFCPGNACIASTFRLDKNNVANQLFKVAIHELGHTQGLPHCPKKFCFMRDAEGKNPTNEEKNFCKDCKAFLQQKGWQF